MASAVTLLSFLLAGVVQLAFSQTNYPLTDVNWKCALYLNQ